MSTGSFDILAEVITQTNEEFVGFLTDKLHQVRGVTKTETFMLLRVYKMNLGGWRMVQVTPERNDSGNDRNRK
jgi:DNA-binding Lrp family transcriptional regulator